MIQHMSHLHLVAVKNVWPIACGVCSSAVDLWVHIDKYSTLKDDTVACATAYTFNQDVNGRFDTLVSCFTSMGFSEQCSTLTAHFSATNAALCASVCIPDLSGNIVLNEASPTCALGPCLSCSVNFTVDYNLIGGRTLQGSGILEQIARPCSTLYPVNLDPCQGALATMAPTGAPQSASKPTGTTSAATSARIGDVALLGLAMAAWSRVLLFL